MTRDAILEVRDLRVTVGTHRRRLVAVDGISFAAARGQALGLVGESGSGKSLTLRAILGLLPSGVEVTAGSIVYDGTDLVQRSAAQMNAVRGAQIGMIFQEPMSALNPVMPVLDQIAEGPLAHLGLGRKAAQRRALELMERVGIPDAAKRGRAYPHEFSGGMRQRVMIAIALSCDPALILCDEPTTALDVTVQDQILALLQELMDELHVSIVYVSHDLAVVAQLCDRVAVMYAGRLLEVGEAGAVFERPRHPYTAGLLEAVPDLDDVRAALVAIPGAPPDVTHLPSGCRFHPRCRFAQDDCRGGEFPLGATGGGSHATACIHPDTLAAPAPAVPDPVA
jgi:oligopeptide/dipeptide ABC transporter ATP-binding protein